MVDFARRALDDVPECRDATYRVRWSETRHGRLPLLVVAFDGGLFAGKNAVPAVAVGLVAVRRGALLEPDGVTLLLEGDRLRSHILRSVHDYLERNGVAIVAAEA